jgi:Effector-associated domain 7
MSTAPPDQWADGRVVGVATSTFLLGAIQARRAEHENRSRDEVIAAVRKGLEDLERQLSASESEKEAWTDKLKNSLSEQLTAVALSVEGCQGRIADLDKSVGSILDRVARVEEFVHAHARGEAVLVELVNCSFTNLSLPAQNLIHDILDKRFTKEHLSVLAERCGVDWDNLAGETKSKKAMELIKECRNSGRFAKLIGEIECKRPGVFGLPN